MTLKLGPRIYREMRRWEGEPPHQQECQRRQQCVSLGSMMGSSAEFENPGNVLVLRHSALLPIGRPDS
jgi:hypothetical protein